MGINKRKKVTIQVFVLAILCGSLIWHIIQWDQTGMYAELYSWLDDGRAYLTVLYNFGVMIALAVVLGLLMCKITDLFSGQPREEDHSDDREETSAAG